MPPTKKKRKPPHTPHPTHLYTSTRPFSLHLSLLSILSLYPLSLSFNNMSSLYTSFIQYNHQHQVAICSDCQTGHTKKTLKCHLSEHPHFFKKHQWKSIL